VPFDAIHPAHPSAVAQGFTVADPLRGPWLRPTLLRVRVARTTVLAYGPQLLRTDPPPLLARAPQSK
jgi:hypothetical protein